MSITFTPPTTTELKPRIVVIGVGGAGGNAVNNMISSGLEGVEFLVTNTDAQALAQSQAERKIQLGVTITEGLGCGARPDIGRAAAEEVIEQIIDHLSGTHMAFITAGMGGGTGTGGAPVIAQACRDQGILTVGVVTKPFHFEGTTRMRIAEGGIEELQNFVDTLIIIPNQNLFRVANEKTTFADAFAMADDVLHSGVRYTRKIFAAPALAECSLGEIAPGPEVDSLETVREYGRTHGNTIYHPVGTCKMGEDPMAVVDPRLRVRGLSGLRVIDASVMPTVTTGNTNAPTIMIAEKGAAMIREDQAA